MSLNEFFYMGGYAFHVWTSYGLTLLLLVLHIVLPIRRRKQLLRRIHKAIKRESAS